MNQRIPHDAHALLSIGLVAFRHPSTKDEDGDLVYTAHIPRGELSAVSDDALEALDGKDLIRKGIHQNGKVNYSLTCNGLQELTQDALTLGSQLADWAFVVTANTWTEEGRQRELDDMFEENKDDDEEEAPPS
jgi:hypothetical protein